MKDIVKIIRYSWSLKRYYLITGAFVLIGSILNQATPFFLKFIVDALDQSRRGQAVDPRLLWWLLGGILAVNVVLTLIQNIQGYYGDMLGAKLNSLLSQRYYTHLLKLPLEYYDNEVAGRITSRLERSIITVSQLMVSFANTFIGFILTALVTLVILAFIAWPLALLLGILFPFYIWLTSLSSKHWQAKQGPIHTATDINNGRFIESVNQIRVVKSFAQELAEGQFFRSKRREIEQRTSGQSVEWHKYDILRRLGLSVVFFGIYAYIILEAFRGRYTLGDVTLLLQLVTTAQFPLFGSSFIVEAIQRAQAGSQDFFSVMDMEPSIKDTPGAKTLQVGDGRVEFKNVKFAYNDGKKVLNGINFSVDPGTKLALVGESGEGKTTITNLLLRFYALSSGRISIDGTDVTTVTQASLRQHIAVVFQEPALFSGTVRDNIAYGQPEATTLQVTAAATAANALGFIEKLPQGFDTEIGERGVKLSGGQKQRVAIARAILKDAPILILDEATSSLDSRAEHEVQAALDQLMRGRTTIIIAHRLSTIASVDKIVGIKAGKIAETGTPAELAQGNGIYAELLALQNPTAANKKRLKQYDIAR